MDELDYLFALLSIDYTDLVAQGQVAVSPGALAILQMSGVVDT